MADAARAAGVVCMEAFHSRYHPVMRHMIEIVGGGEIGQAQRIEAVKDGLVTRRELGSLGDIERVEGAFDLAASGYSAVYTEPSLGGGSLMHLGCYPLSWLRHVLGEEPEVVSAEAKIGPTGVDEALSGEVRFPSGATGYFRGHMAASNYDSWLWVKGTKGVAKATNPLAPQMGHRIRVEIDGAEPVERQLSRRPTATNWTPSGRPRSTAASCRPTRRTPSNR